MNSKQSLQTPNPFANGRVPQLENGERTDQRTFHAWYKTTPHGFKAELIGGEVVVSSPLKISHGEYHALIMTWLFIYALDTPGTRVRDNATVILGEDSEPQPDAALIIDPECGGQTGANEEDYATGPPELIVEIAGSSGAIDLHRKKMDYERAGVKEYVVVMLREEQVRWFVLRAGSFQEAHSPDGVYRSIGFPGLWLDAVALLNLDGAGVMATGRRGMANPEHAAFMHAMAQRRSKNTAG
jgi:Uma2 family endonuclease